MTDTEPDDAIHEISIQAAPGEVWEALVDPIVLSVWFGAHGELEPREGAPVRFRFPDGSERRGLVEDVEPGRRLTWRWRELRGAGLGLVVGPSSTVVIDVVPEGGGTRVRVRESVRSEAAGAHAASGSAW
jgi:uncharacterized protein YndB with AHSA1/START domain